MLVKKGGKNARESFIAAPLFSVHRVSKPMNASIPPVPEVIFAVTKSSKKIRYKYSPSGEMDFLSTYERRL
jgi:hypothetical protein